MYTKVSLRRLPNVCCWLESEVQPPEIEVRLYPSFRHSGQGWEGLKVTPSRHSDNPALCGSSLPERRRTPFGLTIQIGPSQFPYELVFRLVRVIFIVGGLSVIRPIHFARLIILGRIPIIRRLLV